MTIEANNIYQGDVLKLLAECPDNFVDMCCTSPPYFGLRDYKIEKTKWEAITYSILGFEVIVPAMECCLGLESSPKEFIGHLVAIFREVKRVLKKEGTIWINIGDSYAAKITKGLKAKDLIGIPWMLAYALRDDGWFLRQDCIWHKPNPLCESVTDRCTKAHEYIFILSNSSKYYFDASAIKTELKAEAYHMIPKNWAVGPGSHKSIDHSTIEGQKRKVKNIADKLMGINGNGLRGHSGNYTSDGKLIGDGKANKRSVWTVTAQPYSEAHFATFPEDLIVDMIKAGCPEGGIVLDCFGGAGTTALVAAKLNRKYLLFELKEEYVKLADKRLQKELGLFYPGSI